MDRQEIQLAAGRMEKAVEQSDLGALQNQLNHMRPKDQLAVVQELQKINARRHEHDETLPVVEFVQGVNSKGKPVVKELHTENPAAQMSVTLTLDCESGKVIAEDKTERIFTEHYEYDKKGRIVVEDQQFSGASFHNERQYNPKTGKLEREVSNNGAIDSEHTIVEKNYDPRTGKRVSTDVTFPSGTKMHFDIHK
ncbi:MAG: hypothetical protein JSS83_04215 [Cyanobacteria bacterium SZAS LIN-3]|nr:hypothetical protein [Cyanobacteria bacterium SZAS LIN-3]